MKSKVTKGLKETLVNHPEIQHVHFTASGHHFFTVHEYNSAIPGERDKNGLYARIQVKNLVDENNRVIELKHPVPSTRIVETATREEVLGAPMSSDLELSSAMLSGLSNEDRKKVEQIINKVK